LANITACVYPGNHSRRPSRTRRSKYPLTYHRTLYPCLCFFASGRVVTYAFAFSPVQAKLSTMKIKKVPIALKPIYLCSVFGIPVRAHYSWLPVFPFYTWVISSAYLPREVPALAAWQYWALGFTTTALLFVSVLVHELSHSLMARAESIGTDSITLHIFGGLTSLEGQPKLPSSEFKIAVVGPASSFLLGILFFALDQALFYGTTHLGPSQVFRHLGIVNWLLAGFNILPGLPLDGGRVLRAVLWHLRKNYQAATRVAVRAGLTISLALLFAGLYLFLFKEYVTGFWSITIGLILALMLGSSEMHTLTGQHLRRGTVGEVMTRSVVAVAPDMKIQDFITQVLSRNHHRSFPVARGGRLYGMLLLEELKSVPRHQWSQLTAGEAMRPVDETMFISALAPIAEARVKLARNGMGRAVVIDSEGLIVGFVSLRDLK
jgi:Zn-dependent protease